MQPIACIVLPTYNEARNVREVIPRIFAQAAHIPSHQLHVLVVDDESPDGTAQVVQELMSSHANLSLLTGPKRGLGEAYKRGFSHAVEKLSPDVILQMDADGQHDAALIPLFITLSTHGFDLVIGSRFAPTGSTPDFPLYRRLISLVGNWMVRFVGGLPPIHDCTSGFRCIRASLIRKCDFNFLSTRGYSFQTSLLSELLRNGAKVIEVPMTFPDRLHGDSKLTFKDKLEFLQNIARLRFRKSREFVKYSLVGLLGVIVNLGCYLALTRLFAVPMAVANPIAIGLSILSNFALNNAWTFRRRRATGSMIQKMVKFYTVAGIAGVVNCAVFLSLAILAGLHDVWANLFGIGAGMIVNYVMNSIWTWRPSPPTLRSQRSAGIGGILGQKG